MNLEMPGNLPRRGPRDLAFVQFCLGCLVVVLAVSSLHPVEQPFATLGHWDPELAPIFNSLDDVELRHSSLPPCDCPGQSPCDCPGQSATAPPEPERRDLSGPSNQASPSPSIHAYVLTMDLDTEDLRRRRELWGERWVSGGSPSIPVTWVWTRKDKDKRQLGISAAMGHRRALALAERDGADVALIMEDDAAPFHPLPESRPAPDARECPLCPGNPWLARFRRLLGRWPANSSCLLLGAWNIQVQEAWFGSLPGPNRTRSAVDAGLEAGLTPVSRAYGAYAWVIRKKHVSEFGRWLDGEKLGERNRKYSFDTAWWRFWAAHPALVATPLLADHAAGYSYTHSRRMQGHSRWQGGADWWNVWPPSVASRPPPRNNESRKFNGTMSLGSASAMRAIMAVFGVSNRGRGCTTQAHRDHIKRVLEEEGYDVETYVFETIPSVGRPGVDKTYWNETPCSYMHDICETREQSALDVELDELCSRVKRRYENYKPRTMRNALRQLYSEHRVGLFLRSRAKDSSVAVAVGQDIFIPQAIDAEDVRLAAANRSVVFTSQNFDGHGYTNGFYMGNTAVLADIMTRFEHFGHGHDDPSWGRGFTYETELRDAFIRYNVTRRVFKGFTVKYGSFAKIRFNGRHFPPGLPLPPYVQRCLNLSIGLAS